MRLNDLFAWVGALLLLPASFVCAAEFTTEQKQAIEHIVHDYLVENPHVLIEATQVLRAQQQELLQQEVEALVLENIELLFHSDSPWLGNESGDVSIVMFSDYQCVYCREMGEVLADVLAGDQQIRLIVKELPINGDVSEYAAKAALAANRQGKYPEFHMALLDSEGRLNRQQIMKIARSVDLDVDQLRTDLTSAVVQDELQQNMQLAQQLRLTGTPMFIIGGHLVDGQQPELLFIPGALDQETLVELIGQARQ